jgi:hypothetical protein
MRRFAKIALSSLCAASAVATCLGASACGKTVTTKAEVDTVINNVDVTPTVTAAYAQESATQLAVIDSKLNEENIIAQGDDEVKQAAANLFAYACYNEEYVSQYVYLSDRQSSTDLNGGYCKSTNQDYKTVVRKQGETKGLKYHYTLKHVDKAEGVSAVITNAYESTMLRVVDDTSLYRFTSKSDCTYRTDAGRKSELTATWNKKGSDWGIEDLSVTAQPVVSAGDIATDIIQRAGTENSLMKANINIYAENVIQSAMVMKFPQAGFYLFDLTIDTDVANADSASLAMLRNSNSSSDCKWEDGGLQITFVVWESGLFRSYYINEAWQGTIDLSVLHYKGGAQSECYVEYSYADSDVAYQSKINWLTEALNSLN